MGGVDGLLSVELFAAKDFENDDGECFLAVPCRCGLSEADTLRIDGLTMVALREKSIMPIDFYPLTGRVRDKLMAWATRGKPLPVAEFMARGLFNSYFVNVIVAS